MRDLFDKEGYFVRYGDSHGMGISFRHNAFPFSFHSLSIEKVPGERCCPHCNSILNGKDSISVCVHGEGRYEFISNNVVSKHLKFDLNLTAYDPTTRKTKWAILRSCKIEKMSGNIDRAEDQAISLELSCESIEDWHFPLTGEKE